MNAAGIATVISTGVAMTGVIVAVVTVFGRVILSQLADHGRQLADHGRQLAETGRQLAEINRALGRLEGRKEAEVAAGRS